MMLNVDHLWDSLQVGETDKTRKTTDNKLQHLVVKPILQEG